MRAQRTLIFNLLSGRKPRSAIGRLFQMWFKNEIKMARNEFEEGSEWLISMIFGNVANDDILVTSQTFILAIEAQASFCEWYCPAH